MRIQTLTKIGAVLVILAAVLVVGAVVAVKSINLDQIKEVLTTQVKTATGRTLAISGPLELHLGLVPSVAAKGITLSNPAGATRPEMVKIGGFEMEMALLPLLKKEIVVNRLILSSPDILVETETKGPGNLDFTVPAQPGEAKPAEQKQEQKQPPSGEGAFRFTINELKMTNGVVAWYDRDTKKTETVKVQELTLQPDRAGGESLAVRLLAEVLGHNLELKGTIGGPQAILGNKPWPLKLTAQLPGATAQVEGAVANLAAFSGINLKATVQGAELAEVLRLAKLNQPHLPASIGPFKVAAQLQDNGKRFDLTNVAVEVGQAGLVLVSATGTVKDLAGALAVDMPVTIASDNPAAAAQLAGADYAGKGPLKLAGHLQGGGSAWKMVDLKITAGSSDLGGDLGVQLAGRPKIVGKLSANTINVGDFVSASTPGSVPGKAPEAATKAKSDGRVFPNDPLPVAALRSVDADLSLQIGKLIHDTLQLTDVAATIQLNNGNLAIKPLRLGLAGGTIEGEVVLDASGKTPTTALRLNGRQVELGKLDAKGPIVGGKSDIKADLKSSGDTVRALMASATGETSVSVGEGRLRNKAVDVAAGDLLFQVLGAINPFAKKEDATQMECAAVRFVIRDGVATANKGIALRTGQVDVVGSGTVDLRSEKLDLGIKPQPRGGVGLSLSTPLAGLVRVGGTIAKPSIGIDAAGTLKTAASVGAGLATGGLSTVGEMLIDKASADEDPCRTALGQAPQGQSKTKTESRPKQESPGSLLKGMFGR
ncbi:AsmA family protein [Desulfobulbus sp.]|uniref:AsmA family protein n=1 Tax=Desulfobulbus sp. TaxID=895 RepID=UPI00286F9B6C|nr:AsmA family protein [Desulfobulbus sp.]